MFDNINAIQRPGMLGGGDAFGGPLGPFGGNSIGGGGMYPVGGGGGLGGACARCGEGKHQKEMLKAHMDPKGEFIRDGMKAKKADMKSKLSLLKGDLMGAAFYDRMSKKAQYEMGMDYAALQKGGMNGLAGLGQNPFFA
jgi:hypothetical protein